MDNDNLGGEKALLEERRKKLDRSEIKDLHMVIHSNHKIAPKNCMKNLDNFQKRSL